MDNTLRRKIIAVSEEYNADPALSLKYADSAVYLENLISSEDSVIWPLYCGGAAWLAVNGEVRGQQSGKKKRIILVTEKLSFRGQSLFKKLSDMAARKGIRLVNYYFEYECPGIDSDKKPLKKSFIYSFFHTVRSALSKRNTENKTDFRESGRYDNKENIFAALPVNAESFTGMEYSYSVPDTRVHASESEDAFRLNAGVDRENIFYISPELFRNERSALASAARLCGIKTVSEIKKPEDIFAAFFDKYPYPGKKTGNIIYYFSTLPDNIADPLLLTDYPAAVLFVKSDLADALEWAFTQEKPAVIISSLKKTLPGGRKIKWRADVFTISSKKINTDKAGEQINLIVPGYLLSTALNAYRYLSEKGFNIKITVSGVLRPVDFSAYRVIDGGNDVLQIAADFSRSFFISGLSSAYPGDFYYTDQVANGSTLAGAVEKIYRNFRFSKIVDEVKKDKWR